VNVECYSGYKYGERPKAIELQGKRIPILKIIKQWQSKTGPCFIVETSDQQSFELHYYELQGNWEVLQC
jgi:hypothetical protein